MTNTTIRDLLTYFVMPRVTKASQAGSTAAASQNKRPEMIFRPLRSFWVQ